MGAHILFKVGKLLLRRAAADEDKARVFVLGGGHTAPAAGLGLGGTGRAACPLPCTERAAPAGCLGLAALGLCIPGFVLAGALAGVAGVLYGMKYNVFPTMGNVGLKAFIASVIGGLGSVPGAIVGAIILGVIETFVSAFISSSLRDFFSFALLIVLLLVKPSGLFGVDVQDKA